MITRSHPAAEVQRQERQDSSPSLMLLPMLVVIGLGLAIACNQIAAFSEHARWDATFAPAHPDCQTPLC